jgi:hypothetical protein
LSFSRDGNFKLANITAEKVLVAVARDWEQPQSLVENNPTFGTPEIGADVRLEIHCPLEAAAYEIALDLDAPQLQFKGGLLALKLRISRLKAIRKLHGYLLHALAKVHGGCEALRLPSVTRRSINSMACRKRAEAFGLRFQSLLPLRKHRIFAPRDHLTATAFSRAAASESAG